MEAKGPSSALYYQIFNVKPGKGEERKFKILLTTIDSLAGNGLEQTTFDAIGQQLSMRRTHVAYYFANRDELIQTCVRYAVAVGQGIIIRKLSKATSWERRLKAVVEGPFEWLEANPKHAAVMLLFYSLAGSNAKYRALQSTIRTGGEQRILGCIDEAPSQKGATKQAKLQLARQIQAYMTGALVLRFASDYPLNASRLKSQVSKTCLDWLKS